ncbi:cell division protein FtsX [Oceanococcus atlanticus]|uniref:Cell division protein FtsX n=1 Tax=Oceanococcus atlanticus TaxID=1317117 RepID=A0A1Y1SF29_9GAMM|nr:permease-like cell division protein FtsX [Oceanococcus atlanticus]ORE87541.1 cell division protein FtsX [Oceanococcus atlanticus]
MNTGQTLSFSGWLQAHAHVARDSLARLRVNGLSSLLTILMMGCALSLPTTLWVLTQNATLASHDWQRQFSLTLYLSQRINERQGQQLLAELKRDPLVERGEYLSPKATLAEFRDYSGFGRALDLLEDNPLPAVIVLWPKPGTDAAQLDAFLAKQHARTEIDLAQADSDWLERLSALLEFGTRLVQIMGLMLGLTVILVVANTIRLNIESRREEIVVMKLIGAPDGFIQRPFLYSGTLYGLLSGVIACLGVALTLNALTPHLDALAASYGRAMDLQGLALGDGIKLVGLAALMGWVGAWQSVWRNLRHIEPE